MRFDGRMAVARRLMVWACLVVASAVAWSAPTALGRGAMAFEANRGQTDASVRFLARGRGQTLFLSPTEAVLALRPTSASQKPAALHMRLVGANPGAKMTGAAMLPGKVNYYRGNDPAKWRTNVPTYGQVRCQSAYPGIDIVYYGVAQPVGPPRLEYDFVVRPGADPRRIRLAFEGASSLRVARGGDLVASTSAGDVVWKRPVAYQTVAGRRLPVAVAYTVSGKRAAFRVARYDASRPLVVDPIVYCTYLGGSDSERPTSAHQAADGTTTLVGTTASASFPTTAGAWDRSYGGGAHDVVVTKLAADGQSLVYSTFVGGSGDEWFDSRSGTCCVVDVAGAVTCAGMTSSTDLPTTAAAFQRTYGGGSSDAAVFRLSTNGDLASCTYLGGNAAEDHVSVAGDSSGAVTVIGDGASTDFPTTAGAFQRVPPGGYYHSSGFVTRLGDQGQAIYSTLIYGSGYWQVTYLLGCATDATGAVTVVGTTNSLSESDAFPTTAGAYQQTRRGTSDGIVFRLGPTGSLTYCTLLGGPNRVGSVNQNEYPFQVVLDSDAAPIVLGATLSQGFPTTPGAFQPTHGGGLYDLFLTKLDVTGSTIGWSTYLGGSGEDTFDDINVRRVHINDGGEVAVFCTTPSTDFPTTVGAFSRSHAAGATDVAVCTFSSSGSVIYSTLLGGAGANSNGSLVFRTDGSVLVSAATTSSNLSTTTDALTRSLAGPSDAYCLDMDPNGSLTYASYLGGSGDEVPVALYGSRTGGYTMVGYTSSTDLPTTSYSPQMAYGGGASDIFLTSWRSSVSTSLSVPDRIGTKFSSVALKATLTRTDTSAALSDKSVSFTVDGSAAGSATTDAAGLAQVDYTIPEGAASRTIGASFAGDSTYASCTGTGTLIVRTPTTMVVSDVSGRVGNTVALAATLTAGASGLSGKAVRFSVAGSDLTPDATTDAAGKAGYSYVIPAGSVGSRALGAAFAGDTGHAPASATGTLTVAEARTYVWVNSPAVTVGSEALLVAYLYNHLMNGDLNGVAGASLAFSVSGTSIGSATTASDGKARIAHTPPAWGSLPIGVEFAGDADYEAGSGSGTLTVNAIATAVTAQDAAGLTGNAVALKATLKRSSGGAAIPGKTLAFLIDGTAAGSGATDAAGLAQASWTIPAGAASRTIRAEFAGDTVYGAGFGTAMLTVLDPVATSVFVPDRTGTITDPVVLKGYLYRTSDKVYLSGKGLSFSVAGTAVGSADTDAGGQAQLTWTITAGDASRTIQADFAGDAGALASSGYGMLSAQTVNTKVYVVDRLNVKIKTYTVLKAYLYTMANAIITGKTMSMTVDGSALGTQATNSGGYISFGYTVPEGSGAGLRVVGASWAGNAGYAASANTGKLGVVQGNLYIWPYVRSANRGRTLPLKAYVRSLPDYVIQPGKSVAFSVNGTGVGSANVAVDGWASVNWFVPWGEPTGSHTATAAFAGDSWYAAVSANTTFNVVP